MRGRINTLEWQATPPERPTWRKTLYEKQPFPDNYVDDSFLALLVTNANVKQRNFWTMVKSTAAVTQQISIMAVFYLMYAYVNRTITSVLVLVSFNSMLVLMGAAALRIDGVPLEDWLAPRVPELLRLGALFAGLLLCFAPILKTLTATYANDTIWALTIFLSAVHLCFQDYYTPVTSTQFGGILSLNAAFFAAVLLASRLPDSRHVLVFLTFAVDLFAIFPIARDALRTKSERAHLAVTWALVVVTGAWLAFTHRLLAILYLNAVALITFVAPYWFLAMQEQKREIKGPWDHAKVTSLG